MKMEPGSERIAIRWLPVDTLKPDPNNARAHSDRQVARIADSIAAFGFNSPLLVDEEGGVLAGHARLLAAKRLGLKEAPTIALPHLDEARRRAFMIADNRLAELAAWDGVRLGLELEALNNLDLDFPLCATGFELSEIDLRIKSANDGDDREREERRGRTSRSERAVARAGDTWALGPHRLQCGGEADRGAAPRAGSQGGDRGLTAIDAAIRRWQALSGDEARLEPTGETFASLARARRRSNRRGAAR